MTDLALVVSAAARAEQLGFGAAGSTTSLGLVADHDAGMLSSAVSPSELRPAGRVRARSSTPTPRTFPGPSGQSGRLGAHRAASNAAPSRPAPDARLRSAASLARIPCAAGHQDCGNHGAVSRPEPVSWRWHLALRAR